MQGDNKPLEAIAKKYLQSTPKRIQGMLLKTQKYDIIIIYKPGPQMHLADTLSRAFLAIQAVKTPKGSLRESMPSSSCLCQKKGKKISRRARRPTKS